PLHTLYLFPPPATLPSFPTRRSSDLGRDQHDNSLGDVTGSTAFSIAPNGSCTGAACTATVSGAHTVTGTSAGKTGTASLQVNASSAVHPTVLRSSSETIGRVRPE